MSDLDRPVAESTPTTFNILFVCTGNTCRSPMATVIAQRAIEDRGWTHVAVRSAGTAADATGQPAAELAREVVAEHDLDLASHRSHPLGPEDVAWADLVLAMGPANLWTIAELGGADKVALITEFGSAEETPGIADPFGADIDTYRRTFRQLEAAIDAALDRLEPILEP
ncbi:MAG: low molecular weight protein arginine phosphatase [Longimicrobiales bacterium]